MSNYDEEMLDAGIASGLDADRIGGSPSTTKSRRTVWAAAG